MSGLLRKAICLFFCVFSHVQNTQAETQTCDVFEDPLLFCTSPQLVARDVISDTVPGRLFLMWSQCGDEKQQDIAHVPDAWQPACCARDAMSHGTQHLFPLGPIIATSRLRICKQVWIQFRLYRRRMLMTSLPICHSLSNGKGKCLIHWRVKCNHKTSHGGSTSSCSAWSKNFLRGAIKARKQPWVLCLRSFLVVVWISFAQHMTGYLGA